MKGNPFIVKSTTVSKSSQKVKNNKSKSTSKTVSSRSVTDLGGGVNSYNTTYSSSVNSRNKVKSANYFTGGGQNDLTSIQRNNGSERIVSGKRASKVYGRVSKRMKNKL